MSVSLINHSQDLLRLRNDGYEISIIAGHLVMAAVPYAASDGTVKYGQLVSNLQLNGNITVRPSDHVAHFIGEQPCRADGKPYVEIIHTSTRNDLGGGLVINYSFSQKPPIGYYENYYEKMTTYAAMLVSQAQHLDAKVSAKTYIAALSEGDENSVFRYVDTASPRAKIGAVSAKLLDKKIAIVGLGGSGSYLLDFIAKCPVGEIHLFDGDMFQQHNAFRAPGAASLDELRASPNKAERFAQIYDRMHSKIFAHSYHLDGDRISELAGLDFVFVCIDSGSAKKKIFDFLEKEKISFIDSGLGITLTDDARLQGHVRTTTSTPNLREHVQSRVSFGETDDGAYTQNIQIAELNALAAALAVIKWKKLIGFFVDIDAENMSTFTISGNTMLNEDFA